MTERKMRRSQIIGPFGPGAIVDIVGESFVAMDAGCWRGRLDHVSFPRLARRVGTGALRAPAADGRGVPYHRFPQWMFCFHCRRMARWSPAKEVAGKAPTCAHHPDKQLVPMRFVAACEDGHLADVDWHYWAHSGPARAPRCEFRPPDLEFNSRSGQGSGLRSLEVRCRRCSASRSLDGITGKGSLRQQCKSTQPWQPPADERPCKKPLVALQRGASNVYFPTVRSAIDIPPDSDFRDVDPLLTKVIDDPMFAVLVSGTGVDDAVKVALISNLASKWRISAVDVQAEITRQVADLAAPVGSVDDIRPEEWAALCNPRSEQDPRSHFISSSATHPSGQGQSAVHTELRRLIDGVVLVHKLREVRVLTEFKRYKAETAVRANISGRQDFLPAIETFGEGYFIRFAEDAIADWEQHPAVRKRAASIASRIPDGQEDRYPEPTARYLMLHSFAHLLLRNTAFEAGYSTSSLRERLYVTGKTATPEMAGILIYTAAGDSEGTLGGLVRMGRPERLLWLLTASVASAQWCSYDPVCRESSGQGPYGMSMAACHACSLVPETSCDESFNRLLDRRLLIDEDWGFFATLAKVLNEVPGGGTW